MGYACTCARAHTSLDKRYLGVRSLYVRMCDECVSACACAVRVLVYLLFACGVCVHAGVHVRAFT